MKKLISALLVAALLALCTTGAALAADNVKFITSAYVYTDAGAGRTGIVIRKGSVAQFMETSEDWTCVRLGKQAGWVRTSCLTPSDEPVKVVYSAAAATTSAVRSAGALRGASASAIGPVRVTNTIAPDASTLDTVQPGDTVVCLGNYILNSASAAYVEVTHGGTTGWVPAAALSGLPDFE